jgi:AraC family transcriptional regulator
MGARAGHRWSRREARLDAVLRHIGAHCHEPLELAALAQLAGISPFHFQHLFSSYFGESVAACVRRLRLEHAARRLLIGGVSVTEVAGAAGYATPAAFTRAFRRHFGASPRALVEARTGVRPAPAVRRADLPEGPVIRYRQPVRVVGLQRTGSYQRAPWTAWRDLLACLPVHAQEAGSAELRGERIGIPLDWPEVSGDEPMRYEACLALPLPLRGELFERRIEGGRYAVFTHHGPYGRLPAAYEAIFWHWYPRAAQEQGVELRDCPSFDLYLVPPH